MRATAFALIIALSSCAFAVKHPAASAGIVGATLGFTTCEMGTDFAAHGACGLVGGGAALMLGGAVFLAMLLGGEGNTVLIDPAGAALPDAPSIDDVPPTPTPVEPAPTPVEPAPAPAPVAPTPAPSKSGSSPDRVGDFE